MAKSFKIFLVTGILLVLGGLAAPLQAQNRTVSGVVRDDTGEPLFGAFVVQQGTVNGISTDFEGRYTLRSLLEKSRSSSSSSVMLHRMSRCPPENPWRMS